MLNKPSLQTEGELIEKTVDCLRILTTGNERNKLALYSIPAGVKRLISIMTANEPSAVGSLLYFSTIAALQHPRFLPALSTPSVNFWTHINHVSASNQHQCNTGSSFVRVSKAPMHSSLVLLQPITERAAAVIGNLSSTEQFSSAIRECGGLQRLVALLDSASETKVTEIAAKSLANMAGNENNRKGIELAGGRPALISLLTQRPSAEVRSKSVLCGQRHLLLNQNQTLNSATFKSRHNLAKRSWRYGLLRSLVMV